MLDSVKILNNVASANLFDQGDAPAVVRTNNPANLYLRLWQRDRGDRYLPAAGATLSILFPRSWTVGSSSATNPSVDQSFTVSATNPFSNDTSIWLVALTPAQATLVAGGGVQMTLNETINSQPVTTIIFLDFFIDKRQITGV